MNIVGTRNAFDSREQTKDQRTRRRALRFAETFLAAADIRRRPRRLALSWSILCLLAEAWEIFTIVIFLR